MLDSNYCRDMDTNESGVDHAVDAFYRNDYDYPRPYGCTDADCQLCVTCFCLQAGPFDRLKRSTSVNPRTSVMRASRYRVFSSESSKKREESWRVQAPRYHRGSCISSGRARFVGDVIVGYLVYCLSTTRKVPEGLRDVGVVVPYPSQRRYLFR